MDGVQASQGQPGGGDPADFSVAQVADVLWTLTERCNLRCEYCCVIPRERAARFEPTREQVNRLLDQLGELPELESLILSGGEALLSSHIEHVLAESASLARIQYVITNGTVLGARQKRLIEKHQPRVMVSIDSLEEPSNAATRGAGKMVRAVDTVRWLLDAGVFTIVILVFTKHNAGGFQETIEGLYDIGVRNLLVQQLHCPSAAMRHSFLDMLPAPAQTAALHRWLAELRRERPDYMIDDNEVCFFENRPSERALKCDPEKSYLPQRLFMCGAGFNFLALKANGDVIPCNAFLDVPVGNVLREDIKTILTDSPIMQGLRNLRTHRVNDVPGCEACPEAPICDGGCRADVYNLTGEIGDPHPCCPKLAVAYAKPEPHDAPSSALKG